MLKLELMRGWRGGIPTPWWLGVSVLSLLFALACPLAAQTDEQRAGARAVATEGAKAFSEGRYQDAVDLFTRAESLVHAPPHLLYLARANEKLGRLVRAAELYNKIIREELSADAPDAFRDAQTQASEELGLVKTRLAHLTVRVEGGEGQRVVVTMNGQPIASALVGVERPVDPGTHELQATADGLQSALSRITLAEAQREQVVLTLMPKPGVTVAQITGEPPAEAAPREQTSASEAAAPSPASPQQDRGSSSGGLRVGSYVAFGVGAVGIGLGTLFTLQSIGKRSDADDLAEQCGPDCRTTDPEAEEIASLDDEARSAQTLGIVGFIAGGVGVATGVTLLLLSGGSDSETAANEPGITPWVGLGSVGFSGRF